MGETSTGADGTDPDAPWRPGFDGWPDADDVADAAGPGTPVDDGGSDATVSIGRDPGSRAPAPTAAPASVASSDGDPAAAVGGARRRRSAPSIAGALPVAAVALAFVLVVVVGTFVLRRGGETAETSPALSLPETVDRTWTVGFDSEVDAVAVAEDMVVVGSAGGLTALDRVDGREIWRRPELLGGRDIDIDRVALAGDRILVQMPSEAGSDVRAFERATGDEIWASDGRGGAFTIQDPTDRPSVLRRSRVDGRNVGQLIDAMTGEPVGEAVVLSSVSATGRHLGIEPSDRRVSVWSIDRGEVVAGPVDSFGLRQVAPLDGAVVALDLDGRIAAFDDDGVRVDERLLAAPAEGDDDVRADLLGVAVSASTAVVGSETSTGFTVVDDDIEVRWQRVGRVSQLSDVAWGTAGLLVEPDPSGAPLVSIIDAATGATVAAPPDGRERLPTLATGGYLAAPEADAARRVIEAFDYDDRPLWSLSITADADWVLLDGAVVIVHGTPVAGVLTVAG